MEFFAKISEQIGDFMRGLSPTKKLAMGVTSVAILAGIVALFMWAGGQTYSPLMTNLNPEDSANITRLLREKNIPFKVDAGGKNISVSPEAVDTLRMEMAMQGFPQTSLVGYEVFDKQSLGTTSFVQKVNQKRALEGELMRTINAIHGVKRSRVQLAIPQKSTFVEDQKKTTASVLLDLDPGTQLNDKQVFGIANLVSRAVEGLDHNDVVIVDSLGRTLSKNNNDPLSQMTSTQLDFRTKFEQEAEKRVTDLLARVVGDGRVATRVTADLDFSQSSEVQTTYDQDGAAVSGTVENTKSMEGNKPAASGAAGAASNTPIAQQPPGSVRISDTKIADKVTNFKIPETVRKTTRAPGSIKRLSVAVVVDGRQVKIKGADGKVESKTEAWSPEKIKEFEAIVASAVGLDRKRGDTLEIKNMEFNQADFADAEALIAEKEKKSYMQSLLVYATMGLIIVLFFFVVVRPFIKWVTDNTTDGVETFLPQTLEELEKLQKGASTLPGLEDAMPSMPDAVDPEKIEGEIIKEKIITLVDANPQKAALIIKDWLAAPAHGVSSSSGDAKKSESKDAGKSA